MHNTSTKIIKHDYDGFVKYYQFDCFSIKYATI